MVSAVQILGVLLMAAGLVLALGVGGALVAAGAAALTAGLAMEARR